MTAEDLKAQKQFLSGTIPLSSNDQGHANDESRVPLYEQIERWREKYLRVLSERDAARTERDRLRAALERLTNGFKYSTEVVTIARDALSSDPNSPSETSERPAADATFETAARRAGVFEPLEVYTSNSYRRVGLKGEYKVVLGAYRHADGQTDIGNTELLDALVAAFNAMLPRLRSAPKAKEHRHTDECWEPDSGCDMGRNEKYVSGPVAPGSESGANAKGAGGEKP